jgi:hypothetical protein
MKPNPFSVLNHFTVPVAIATFLEAKASLTGTERMAPMPAREGLTENRALSR